MNDIRTAWVDVVHFTFRWMVVLGVCLPGLAARSGRAQEGMGPKLEVERVLGNPAFRHADDVTALVPLADGKRLLSAARDATVRLWEIETGRELKRYRHAYMGEVWDVILRPGKDEFFSCGSSGIIIHWDMNRGEKLKEYDPPEDVQVDCLAVTPDGQRLIAGDRGGAITVWNVETGKMLARLTGHNGCVYAICLAADGKRLYSGGADGKVIIWDMEKLEQVSAVQPDGGKVMTVKLAPDGNHIALITCKGRQKHNIHVLRSNGEPVIKWADPHLTHSLVWTPDSKQVAARRVFSVIYYDLEKPEPVRELQVRVPYYASLGLICWSVDAKTAFVPSERAIVHVELQKGYSILELKQRTLNDFSRRDDDTVFNPKTEQLYFDIGRSSHYRAVDTKQESELIRRSANDIAGQMACSPDGKTLVSVCRNTFRIFDAESGKELRKWQVGDKDDPILVAFTGPGQTVSVHPESAAPIILCDIGTGAVVASLALPPNPPPAPPEDMNMNGMDLVMMRDGGMPQIRQATTSADGRHLLTVDEQEAVLVWDLGRQAVCDRIVRPLEQKIEHVALGGPDGRWVALAADRKVFFYLPPADEAPARTAEWLKERIPQLGAATFQERRQAQQDILAAGPSILPLVKDLQSDDPEIGARLREIREALAQQGRDRVIQATLNLRMPCRDLVFLDDIHWAAIENYGADSVVVLGAIRDGKAVVLDRLSHEHGPEKLVRHTGKIIITNNGNNTFSRLRIVK